MKAEVKQKWVNALRSGDYTQGRWKLSRIDDYTDTVGEGFECHCVLGVLADLAAREGIISYGYDRDQDCEAVWTEFRVYSDPTYADEETGYDPNVEGIHLPISVARWAGLDETVPYIPHPSTGEETLISDLNDGGGLSFEQLADLIEKHL